MGEEFGTDYFEHLGTYHELDDHISVLAASLNHAINGIITSTEIEAYSHIRKPLLCAKELQDEELGKGLLRLFLRRELEDQADCRWLSQERVEDLWDLAESAVDILITYEKVFGRPSFDDWCSAFATVKAAAFVQSLYEVTHGKVDVHFHVDDARDSIQTTLSDPTRSSSDFARVAQHICYRIDWLAGRLPKGHLWKIPWLLRCCADLTRYLSIDCCDIPLKPPDGAFEILAWDAGASIPLLCAAYCNRLDADLFAPDNITETIWSLQEKLAGGSAHYLEHLMAVVFTSNQLDAQLGALELLQEGQAGDLPSAYLERIRGFVERAVPGELRDRFLEFLPESAPE
jgi:hypothetical protein